MKYAALASCPKERIQDLVAIRASFISLASVVQYNIRPKRMLLKLARVTKMIAGANPVVGKLNWPHADRNKASGNICIR